jgi:ATP-binding cassette, subfamily F, member 3
VCDEFWMVSRGGVAPFDGDLDDYQRYLLDESKRLREAAKPVKESPSAAASNAPKNIATPARVSSAPSQRMKRNLDQAEAQMAQLQAQQNTLHKRLMLTLPPAELAHTAQELKTVDAALALAEQQWLTLTEQMETQQS